MEDSTGHPKGMAMEDSTGHPRVMAPNGITRTERDVLPSHYLFKIESFSLLQDTRVERYESGDFAAGGYNWRLSLYPNGNKKDNGSDHISLYLVIESSSLSPDLEATVEFKLFVFDQTRDKYLTIQDSGAKLRRFHCMKTEWGFGQLLRLDTFKDASNGYLVDDCCAFGAEVFVVKRTRKGECLSMIREPQKDALQSKKHGVSLVVGLSGRLDSNRKCYVKFKLRIKNQLGFNHAECSCDHWFSETDRFCGCYDILLPSDINDSSKGFLVMDTLIAEVEFEIVSVVKDLFSK